MIREWNPSEAYQNKAVADSYDCERFTSTSGRLGDRKEKKAFLRLLNTIPGNATLALDVPCGTGRITEVLIKNGYEVKGADISLQMIDKAKEKLKAFAPKVSFEIQNLDSLTFANNSFDLVTCVRLFGHFPSQTRIRMLKEMARVTRRWIIVQYFYKTGITQFKRLIKKHLLKAYEGVQYPLDEHLLGYELHEAGLKEEGRAWCRKYYSEEVFVLLSKSIRESN